MEIDEIDHEIERSEFKEDSGILGVELNLDLSNDNKQVRVGQSNSDNSSGENNVPLATLAKILRILNIISSKRDLKRKNEHCASTKVAIQSKEIKFTSFLKNERVLEKHNSNV